jgi:hypothetical protein
MMGVVAENSVRVENTALRKNPTEIVTFLTNLTKTASPAHRVRREFDPTAPI